MKLRIVLSVFLSFICLSISWINAQQQEKMQNSNLQFEKLFHQNDIKSYFDSIPNNESIQLERLSAYFFHQKINEYRQQNQLPALYWDERMWLAARNHNLYQWKLGNLTHVEAKSGSFYSGINPWDRMQYVMYGAFRMEHYGENVLYNFSYDSINTMTENARNIANKSFEQWKNSPPHNKNMLNHSYYAHGTSFIVVDNGSRVYGTSNFGNASDFVENEISISWDSKLQQQYPPILKKFAQIEKEYQWKPADEIPKINYLVKQHMPSKSSAVDKHMRIIAGKHLTYMLANNSFTTKELSNKQKFYSGSTRLRYLKSAGFDKLFYVLTHSIYEKIIVMEFSKEELQKQQYIQKLNEKLFTVLPTLKLIEKWGSAIQITEIDGKYLYIIDLVYELQ